MEYQPSTSQQLVRAEAPSSAPVRVRQAEVGIRTVGVRLAGLWVGVAGWVESFGEVDSS